MAQTLAAKVAAERERLHAQIRDEMTRNTSAVVVAQAQLDLLTRLFGPENEHGQITWSR